MPFQGRQVPGGSPFEKLGLEVRIGQPEGDVHDRTARRLGVLVVEAVGLVDRVVEELGLLPVQLVHRLQTAHLAEQPVGNQLDHVDRKDGRRVQQRLSGRQLAVVEHGRQSVRHVLNQIVADDHDGHARRPGVLLGAGVEDAVLLDRHGPAQKVTRRIAHQRHVAHFRLPGKLHTLDRLVRGDVYVGGLRVQVQLRRFGHARVAGLVAVPGYPRVALDGGLGHRLLAPRAGENEVGRLAGAAQEVHRNHSELHLRPALQKQDVIAVGNPQQLAQVRLGLLDDLGERFRTVADLKNRRTHARQGQQIALGLLQRRSREHGRARREIGNSLDHFPILTRQHERQESHSRTRRSERQDRQSNENATAVQCFVRS